MIVDLEESTGRLAGWRLGSGEFNSKIVYKTGTYHEAAKEMFRCHVGQQKMKRDVQASIKISWPSVLLGR